jgi:hypothetical protein
MPTVKLLAGGPFRSNRYLDLGGSLENRCILGDAIQYEGYNICNIALGKDGKCRSHVDLKSKDQMAEQLTERLNNRLSN